MKNKYNIGDEVFFPYWKNGNPQIEVTIIRKIIIDESSIKYLIDDCSLDARDYSEEMLYPSFEEAKEYLKKEETKEYKQIIKDIDALKQSNETEEENILKKCDRCGEISCIC